MNELPASVTLSKRVTDQFRVIKTKTGVTNNVLARIAISLAIESGESIKNAHREDAAGQTLDKDLLFGDLRLEYEVAIREYLKEDDSALSPANAIASLVEIGAHKMAHVRSLEEFVELGIH